MSGPSSSRESIRPSLKDLSQSDDIDWPSAASSSRNVPPPSLVKKAKGAADGQNGGPKKTVKIAQPSQDDVRYFEPTPKERPAPTAQPGTNQASRFMQRRFLSRPPDGQDDEEDGDGLPAGRFELNFEGEEAGSSLSIREAAPSQPMRPVMGGVQERTRQSRPQPTAPENVTGPSAGSSRFKAVREAERQAACVNVGQRTSRPLNPPKLKAPSVQPPQDEGSSFGLAATTGLPRSSELAAIEKPSADPEVTSLSGRDVDEEWLDEDGTVMSAFRKARLKKEGRQPPGGIIKKSSTATRPPAKTFETPDEGGGNGDIAAEGAAAPDIDPLMRSISTENEAKIKGMKTEDIEQDLKDLEAMFGKDVLEGLKNRKAENGVTKAPERQEEKASDPQSTPPQPLLSSPGPAVMKTSSSRPRFLFDAQGKALAASDSGLQFASNDHGHVHETSGDQEGYSTTSVLLLARSTIAAQRSVALGIISNIAARYGAQLASKSKAGNPSSLPTGQAPIPQFVATELVRLEFHLNAALAAILALHDRQLSVRHAALSCLRVALSFGALETEVKPSMPQDEDEEPEQDQPRSICAQILDAGLLSGLHNVLNGDTVERNSSRELIVAILIQLVDYDDYIGDALVESQSSQLLESLLASTLKLPWPSSRSQPVPRAINLLRSLVCSSRMNAQALVQRESIDCVLRYVAIPPWQLEQATRERAMGFELFTTCLDLFTDLGKYGMYASLVSRCWDLLEPVQPWALQRLRGKEALELHEARLLQSYYDLLTTWTVCATDPHQTTPEHEVTWTQLEGWIEGSLDVMQAAVGDPIAEECLTVLAAASRHCKVWLDGADVNAPALKGKFSEQVQGVVSEVCGKTTFQSKLQGLLDVPSAMEHQANGDGLDDNEEEGLSASEKLVLGSQLGNMLLSFSPAQSQQMVAEASTELLQDLEGALSLSSTPSERLTILSLAVEVALSSHGSTGDLFAILNLLRAGEETIAARAIRALQSRAAAAISPSTPTALSSLTPFFLECLDIRPNVKTEAQRPLFRPPIESRPANLKRTMTLRTSLPSSSSGRSLLQRLIAATSQADNTDPTTSSLLWTCPASRGLSPSLRPDWPLLPLDDLLRSAEAAVFNRANNLPEEGWDPNEREVVRETLLFAAWCVEQLLETDAMGDLTASHLWFACQKVFMLESGLQGDLSKWTGAVTGKDLFRDKEVESLLGKVMKLAATLAAREATEKRMGCPTLEDLAACHLASTDPSAPPATYYSFYIDLVALYDAISYGHPLFAAALMPPLAMKQYPAPDYRRLIWRDHEHLLATLKVRIEDVGGAGALRAYLAGEEEKEGEEADDLLRAYAGALLNRLDVTRGDEELMPRVALHRVSRFLWSEGTQDERLQRRRAALGRTMATNVSPALKEALLRYDWNKEAAVVAAVETLANSQGKYPPAAVRADEFERRTAWLSSLSSS